MPEGEVPLPDAPGAIGAPLGPGAKVRGTSDEEPGVVGAAAGGPIVAGAKGAASGDNTAGGRLMSAGPGNGVPDNGAGPDAHEEHPPGAT